MIQSTDSIKPQDKCIVFEAHGKPGLNIDDIKTYQVGQSQVHLLLCVVVARDKRLDFEQLISSSITVFIDIAINPV